MPPAVEPETPSRPMFVSIPTRMPFGKYKGKLIVDLPDEYLEWLSGVGDLHPPLSIAIMRELRERWLSLGTRLAERQFQVDRLERQVDRLSKKSLR